MHILRLSGSYYDVGFSCGRELRAVGFTVPHANSVDVRFARDSMHEVRRTFPEVVDEIEGLGLGLKANYKDVMAMVLTNHVIHDDHSIAFAVGRDSASGKGSLLARNYNRHYKRVGHDMAIKASPKGALASFASTDAPVVRQDGMNSAGLAVAGSTVPGGGVGLGISPTLAIRAVLDTCRDVDGALHLLSEMKHAREFSFLLTDRSGVIALAEVGPGHFDKKTYDKGIVIATNRFQIGNMWKGSADAATRHTRLKGLVGGIRSMSPEVAISALSDHKGMLCEHGKGSEFNTAWASVFSTRRGRIVRSDGHPCETERKEYSV